MNMALSSPSARQISSWSQIFFYGRWKTAADPNPSRVEGRNVPWHAIHLDVHYSLLAQIAAPAKDWHLCRRFQDRAHLGQLTRSSSLGIGGCPRRQFDRGFVDPVYGGVEHWHLDPERSYLAFGQAIVFGDICPDRIRRERLIRSVTQLPSQVVPIWEISVEHYQVVEFLDEIIAVR